MSGLTLIGSDHQAVFQQNLDNPTNCFGKRFAKSAVECKQCTAPVIGPDKKLYLLREVCEARCKGFDTPALLRTLTSQAILSRLEQGHTPQEICTEVMGEGVPSIARTAAVSLLDKRLSSIRSNGART